LESRGVKRWTKYYIHGQAPVGEDTSSSAGDA
jgi:hypothetical protein